MTILIVYGSNSSGTMMASQSVSDVLTAAGHTVTITAAQEAQSADFPKYDLVILGSCTWDKISGTERLEGQLQEHMEQFLAAAENQKFEHQKFALFGLGDSSYEKFCGAADHLEAFVTKVGGQPVVPTLRIDGYFQNKEENDEALKQWAESVAAAISKQG